jgi:ABC-type polysaccharide/polyol phosphate export permease
MKTKIKKLLSDLEFLWQFSLDDFKKKYAGSVGGVVWAVFQPLFTVLLYWFVFQVGLKSGSVTEVPFILWLIAGLLPWLYFSETVNSSVPALSEYSYLVKKVRFNINILPMIKIVSGLLVHGVLIGVMIAMYGCYGFGLSIYYVQIFFYLIYIMLLMAGALYLLCSLYVFFKDIIQIVGIFFQFAFWTTPIVWSLDIMSPTLQKILQISPFYYFVNGYRDCFVNHVWFWERGWANLYYWTLTLLILAFGLNTFKKCKPHFADVL